MDIQNARNGARIFFPFYARYGTKFCSGIGAAFTSYKYLKKESLACFQMLSLPSSPRFIHSFFFPHLQTTNTKLHNIETTKEGT